MPGPRSDGPGKTTRSGRNTYHADTRACITIWANNHTFLVPWSCNNSPHHFRLPPGQSGVPTKATTVGRTLTYRAVTATPPTKRWFPHSAISQSGQRQNHAPAGKTPAQLGHNGHHHTTGHAPNTPLVNTRSGSDNRQAITHTAGDTQTRGNARFRKQWDHQTGQETPARGPYTKKPTKSHRGRPEQPGHSLLRRKTGALSKAIAFLRNATNTHTGSARANTTAHRTRPHSKTHAQCQQH